MEDFFWPKVPYMKKSMWTWFPGVEVRQKGLVFVCSNGGVTPNMPLQAVSICTAELVI